jgi:hypothetical protein
LTLDNAHAWTHAAWTPMTATGDDAGGLACTITPTASDPNDALVLTFVGHIGAAANTFHVKALCTTIEVA